MNDALATITVSHSRACPSDSTPEDMPNRKPDMSEAAGAAMRAVLHEVGLGNATSGGIEPGALVYEVSNDTRGSPCCVIA